MLSLTLSAKSRKHVGLVAVEAVERDLEARVVGLLERVQQQLVGGLVGGELEDHAVGRERQRPQRQQELTRDVDVHRARAGELGQADVGDRLRQHARGHPAGVVVLRRQQLEGHDPLEVVEDRLAGDDDRFGLVLSPDESDARFHTRRIGRTRPKDEALWGPGPTRVSDRWPRVPGERDPPASGVTDECQREPHPRARPPRLRAR